MYLAYVYRVTNINTNEFYIGLRTANVRFKRNAEDDLLKYYFTSGKLKKEIKENTKNFSVKILFRSNEKDAVYWYEQVEIRQNLSNTLCKNKSYIDPDSGRQKFDTSKTIPWNKGISPSEKTRELWSKQRTGKLSHMKGRKLSEDVLEKHRIAHNTEDYKSKMSTMRLENNGMSKWTYTTPKGVFTSPKIAALENNLKLDTFIWRCKHTKFGFSKSLT